MNVCTRRTSPHTQAARAINKQPPRSTSADGELITPRAVNAGILVVIKRKSRVGSTTVACILKQVRNRYLLRLVSTDINNRQYVGLAGLVSAVSSVILTFATVKTEDCVPAVYRLNRQVPIRP